MKPSIPIADSGPESSEPSLESALETVEQLEEILAAAPILKAVRWRLAEAYLDRGEPAAAARTLAGSPSWPENVGMLEFAGRILLEADHPAAEDVFEEILFRDPRHIGAHRSLANVCRDSGREEEAQQHERAADAIRDHPLPKRKLQLLASPAAMIRQRVQRILTKRSRAARGIAIAVAIAVHLILFVLVALWIVSDGDRWAEVRLNARSGSPDPPPAPSHKFVESVQQKPQPIRRQSNPPLVASIEPVPIFVPNAEPPDLDDPLNSQFGAPLSPIGKSGAEGKEGSGGGGAGPGGEVEFFGTRSQASRVVFIVDFSSSMRKGERLPRLKKELHKSLAKLREGMLFNIIYYADHPWLGDALSRVGRGRSIPTNVHWRVASSAEIKMTMVEVTNMHANGSTYWTPPLKLAVAMDPQPDLIWLLSDGDAADRRSLLKKLERLVPEGVRINTVGLELGGAPFQSLVDIAKQTGGEFSIIMNGIAYIGDEALRFTSDVYGKAEN